MGHIRVGTYLGQDIFSLNYLNYILGHIWVGTELGQGHKWVQDIIGLGHVWPPLSLLNIGTYLGQDIFGLNYPNYILGHIWVGT